MTFKLSAPVKHFGFILLKLYTPIILLFLSIIIINYQTNIGINIFTSDPAVIAGAKGVVNSTVSWNINPFVGIVSNIGILCWCVCASICFFSAEILRSNTRKNKPFRTIREFLYCFGTISVVLLLDDLLLFHETIAPNILNISEQTVYVSYAIIISGAIFRYRKIIAQTEWNLFGLAFLFLGSSVFIDGLAIYFNLSAIFKPGVQGLQYLLEDGCKLLGIVSWVGYFVRLSLLTLQESDRTEIKYSAIDEKISHLSIYQK